MKFNTYGVVHRNIETLVINLNNTIFKNSDRLTKFISYYLQKYSVD